MGVVTWTIPGVPTTTTTAAPTGPLDHVAGALSRLLEQWKGKPNIAALLSSLAGASQPIESALQQLLTQRFVTTAIGAQLDVLGSLVGQPRNGLSDADYARYIQARISTNRSSGTIEDLITVARLVLVGTTGLITITPRTVASVEALITGTAVSDALAAILIAFLEDAHAGGVHLVLLTQPALDAATFFTGTTVFVTGALSPGATQAFCFTPNGQTAVDFARFPNSGSLIFEQGTATTETVAYSSKVILPGPFYGFNLSAPLAIAHGASTAITLASGLGLGLGDGTEGGQPTLTPYSPAGTTGGELADARE
jgi:hypothetical protein